MQRVGLISDTHGLLRPEALDFLRGCDLVVHGGDICDREVLALAKIAPVVAVRGNNDRGATAGMRVVVYGHSHKPSIDERDGVLYINPGSAGPRRFKLPISVGELRISGATIAPRLVTLGG